MNELTIQLIMLVALFGVMYFILIRPQRKREKEVNEMRDSLKVGDDIITIGGIFGKVVRIREERLTIQVGAERVRLEVAKWAVSQKVDSGDKPAPSVVEDADEPAEEQAAGPTPKSIKKLGKSNSDS